jgi:hypothetical protein
MRIGSLDLWTDLVGSPWVGPNRTWALTVRMKPRSLLNASVSQIQRESVILVHFDQAQTDPRRSQIE